MSPCLKVADALWSNMSHVDVKNMKPTSFEDEYYDEYEYYNLTDKYAGEERLCFSSNFVFLCVELFAVLLQRARPVKAGQRRRPVKTPTDTIQRDTSARSWRSSKTARRRTKSEH